jgi:hypothetical protein
MDIEYGWNGPDRGIEYGWNDTDRGIEYGWNDTDRGKEYWVKLKYRSRHIVTTGKDS